MRSLRSVLSVSVAVIGLPVFASASLLLDGTEFQVNTYTTSQQSDFQARSVARAPDGSFVVVWNSYGQDGDNYGVHGQRYTSAGAAAGSEFQVNTYTTDSQSKPAVSAAADGSFVVVWQSYGQDGNLFGVHGQRYNSAAAAAGTEFQVNTYTSYNQRDPSVSAAADGSFVVVWRSYNQDGSYSSNVHGQRYNSAGAAAGTEFQVNTYATSSQEHPCVSAAADDGSFVVVWESLGQDGDSYGVHGQRYTSAGASAGTEFQVNTYTTFFQFRPAVSAAADGSFVVVWNSYGQDGGYISVQGQRYDSAGAAAGTEFQGNTYTTNNQRFPAVSTAADGSFVVVWDSYGQDGSNYSVNGQRYTSAGAAAGTEFQVNTYTTNFQGYSSIAVDSVGDFVVVWDSIGQDGDGGGMFAQRLCQDGDSNSVCDSTEYCGPSPATGCLTGAKASFQVKDSTDDTKDQIKWKFGKGGAFDQAALGDPILSRIYLLCIYDSTSGAPSLVSTLRVDPNVGWTTKDPKGFQYKDKTGAEDGVTKAKLKTGAAGKTSASIGAKGTTIPMPAPLSGTEFFDQDTTVTVQLVNNQTATCWTSAFTTAKKNDGVQFKATAP